MSIGSVSPTVFHVQLRRRHGGKRWRERAQLITRLFPGYRRSVTDATVICNARDTVLPTPSPYRELECKLRWSVWLHGPWRKPDSSVPHQHLSLDIEGFSIPQLPNASHSPAPTAQFSNASVVLKRNRMGQLASFRPGAFGVRSKYQNATFASSGNNSLNIHFNFSKEPSTVLGYMSGRVDDV